jgi:hypothetical protein
MLVVSITVSSGLLRFLRRAVARPLCCGDTVVIFRKTQQPFFNKRVCVGRKLAENARSIPIKLVVHAGSPLEMRGMCPLSAADDSKVDHKFNFCPATFTITFSQLKCLRRFET